MIHECDLKFDRYRALLEAGTDPSVVAGWISEVEGERRRAQAFVDAATRETVVAIATAAEVRQVVEELGGLIGLLNVSEPKLRSRFYEELASQAPTTRTPAAWKLPPT